MKSSDVVLLVVMLAAMGCWVYAIYAAFQAEWAKAAFFLLLSTSTEIRATLRGMRGR